MNIKKLIELRNAKKAEMEGLLGKAVTEERAMDETEKAKFDALEAEIRSLDGTIKAYEASQKLEIIEGKEEEKAEEDVEKAEERAFENFVRGAVLEERADSFLTQGSNGKVVPLTISNRIVTIVKEQVDFMKYARVEVVNGTLAFPKYTDSNEAAYVDETSETEAKNGSFTTIDLTGYVIEAVSIISKKMITNVDFDIVSFVINEVAKKIVNKLEKEFINGTASKITGILSTANTVTAAASTAVTYDELVKVKHELKTVFQKNGVFVMHPETYTSLCLLKDGNQQPYFKDDDYKILNRPVLVSENMPKMVAGAKAIVYGDLSGYVIKLAKSMEINVLYELYARKNSVGVQALVEVDANIVEAQKITSITMKSA